MKVPKDLFVRITKPGCGDPTFALVEHLREAQPNSYILVTTDSDFNLDGYSESGGCASVVRTDVDYKVDATWIDGRLKLRPTHALIHVDWRNNSLFVARFSLGYDSVNVIVADSVSIAESFFIEVCKWNASTDDSVLVFSNGYFSRDDEMKSQIESASLADLTLNEDQRRQLDVAILRFFEDRETFKKYRLPWKRGAILHGPPGNGKTFTLRALLRSLRKPSLVVRSFEAEDDPVPQNIRTVFNKARELAPCVLILEDLDALIPKDHLSVLLNEIDGLAVNEGILTLATTNHLEKIDPALAHRPSRFDRKIYFPNPDETARFEYMTRRTQFWEEGVRPSEETLREVAVKTNDFSIAFLQEMLSSSLMVYLREGGEIGSTILAEVKTLRGQIHSSPDTPSTGLSSGSSLL